MPKQISLGHGLIKEYWPFLLPILILLPGLSSFPYPGSAAQYSDFAVTHYPNAFFLKAALLTRKIPLWSSGILSGFPFIAHPYSGLWYPPYWLALIFPLPLGLNLIASIHLVWAGIGAYKLLRQSGLGRQAAVFGGLAFEAAPALFAHLGAGHLMLLLAVCWTPWLLWAASRGPASSRMGRMIQPGLILALIFVADPRWAIYAGGLWLCWEIAREGEPFQKLRRIGKQIVLVSAFSAPALWLYAEYASLSTRVAITTSEVLVFSLPPAALIGLLIPQLGQFYEWVLYPGVLVLALVLIAAPWKENRLRSRFWLAVLAAALLLSLGAHVPGMRLVAALPGFSQLRVPPRALLLAALALSAMAAQGLEILLNARPPLERIHRVEFALLTLCLSFGVTLGWIGNRFWSGALWAAALLVVFSILVEILKRKKLLAVALCALLLLDLAAMDASLVDFRPAQEIINQNGDAAAFLAAQPGAFRVYSPSFSIPQQTAARFGLELADGVDPLQLSGYAGFMEKASGVPVAGYSVTLPPLANSGDPASANGAYKPDPAVLGLLNVEYVISQFPLQVAGLEEIKQVNGSFIYRNEFARPRAWVENADAQMRPVDEINWNYNCVLVRAQGPGLLVLSEIAYPGWKARIDGRVSEMRTSASLLRAVPLAAGTHEVIFSFEPEALLFSLPIPVITLTLLLAWPRRPRKMREK